MTSSVLHQANLGRPERVGSTHAVSPKQVRRVVQFPRFLCLQNSWRSQAPWQWLCLWYFKHLGLFPSDTDVDKIGSISKARKLTMFPTFLLKREMNARGLGCTAPRLSLPFSSFVQVFTCKDSSSRLPANSGVLEMAFVRVHLGRCNKIPQTRWPRNSTHLFLTVLEAGALKSGCQHGWMRASAGLQTSNVLLCLY